MQCQCQCSSLKVCSKYKDFTFFKLSSTQAGPDVQVRVAPNLKMYHCQRCTIHKGKAGNFKLKVGCSKLEAAAAGGAATRMLLVSTK